MGGWKNNIGIEEMTSDDAIYMNIKNLPRTTLENKSISLVKFCFKIKCLIIQTKKKIKTCFRFS